MAKIILTARYVKNISPGQMKNYVKYIATRPNSEKYSHPLSAEVSELQSDWIIKELKKSPRLKKECATEYQAYEENPSCRTAENLIHKIAEINIYHGNDMKNYVDTSQNALVRSLQSKVMPYGMTKMKRLIYGKCRKKLWNIRDVSGTLWSH